MKKILFLFAFLPLMGECQIRLSTIDLSQDLIVLKNYDTFDVDIQNYRITSNGVDTPISKILVFGKLQMRYNDIAILKGLPLDETFGYITFHDTTSSNLDSSLVDFIQWGKSGQNFESTAVGKKYWDSAAFIPGSSPFQNSCWYYSFKCWSSVKRPIIIMRFAYVSPSQNRFCIKNAGVSNIDMKYAGICIGNTCLDSMTDPHLSVVKGNMNVLKNDSIVFQLVNMDLDTTKGSMALFAVNKFNKDTTNLLDYVSWGDSLQAYSGIAHLKGIWDSTTTVHLTTAKDSIVYTGDFTQLQSGAQWWQSRTPVYVPGIGVSKISMDGIRFFPNPATEGFYVSTPNPAKEIQILDLQGRVLFAESLYATNKYVSTAGLTPGIYLCRLHVNGQWSLPEKLIIQE